MKLRSSLQQIVLLVAALATVCGVVSAQTVDEIVAKYIAARGLDKLQQMQTVWITRHIVSNGFVTLQISTSNVPQPSVTPCGRAEY